MRIEELQVLMRLLKRVGVQGNRVQSWKEEWRF